MPAVFTASPVEREVRIDYSGTWFAFNHDEGLMRVKTVFIKYREERIIGLHAKHETWCVTKIKLIGDITDPAGAAGDISYHITLPESGLTGPDGTGLPWWLMEAAVQGRGLI